MNQLFSNLVSNALKFSSPDSIPAISLQCRFVNGANLKDISQLDKRKDYYEIIFSDNGIGFRKEFAEQIFVIFQRLNERPEYKGTGIGLALCRKVVRNHGGEIYAESEEGKGSAFYIILPVNATAKDGKENKTSA